MRLITVNPIPINFTSTSININFGQRKKPLTPSLPQKSNNPEGNDNGYSQHYLEEAGCGVDTATERPDGDVELLYVRLRRGGGRREDLLERLGRGKS
jgi:hypothetical protein